MKITKKAVNRIVNGVAIVFILVHGGFSLKAFAYGDDWAGRINVVEEAWQYKLLNPLSGSSLGFTFPGTGTGFVNKAAIVNLGADLNGVVVHEAKHLQQVQQLGLIDYFLQDDWKIEGIAEFARGKPTLKICGEDDRATESRLKYREYFVVTKYLIDEIGLSEDEFYHYSEYPVAEAERWIQEEECAAEKLASHSFR